MGCTTTASTFTVSSAFVSWGRKHKTCISTDAAVLTGGEHLFLSSKTVDYYLWFDVDNGSVDPAPAGRTAIEVDLTSPFTAADISAAIKTAVEAVQESSEDVFRVDIKDTNTCACIEMIEVGAILNASADVDTGLTVENTVTGLGGDLGTTEGAIEVAFEATTLDVVADQTGESLRDKIITGTKTSVSMSLLEMTAERWGLIVGEVLGDRLTPGGGTEVIGFGESRNFKSLFNLGGELKLHPVKNDADDLSEDLTFWITAPVPESINFSGSETQKMAVTFEALVDRSKDSKISLFTYGDSTQDLRA